MVQIIKFEGNSVTCVISVLKQSCVNHREPCHLWMGILVLKKIWTLEIPLNHQETFALGGA